MNPRMKVVFITAGCDGTDVGEAWSTFQWASRLSQRHELTVLTWRKQGAPSATSQLPDAEVVEWDDWPLDRLWERFNSVVKPGYVSFYRGVRRWLRQAMSTGRRFDLIHQVTPLALRYPCPAVGLGVPFIVGPLAGSLSTPEAFRKEFSASPWYTYLRGLDRLRFKYDPYVRNTYRQAEIVIGVAPYVKDMLDMIPVKRFEVMCETGVIELPQLREKRAGCERCRLLYVGRVTRTKGVRDAIRAVSHIPNGIRVTLEIVGDGDDRAQCEEEVRRLRLDDCVTFRGRLPRREVDEYYRESDVFLFPSFREPSGNVVLEAMSFGLPLIVADRGGPGHVVDDSLGIRVPVSDPSEYPKQLASAILALARDPEKRALLGANARCQIEMHYLWERKVDLLSQLYLDIIVSRPQSGNLLPHWKS